MADLTAEEKYRIAKAWLASNKSSPDYANVSAKVSEYERYNPSHNAPVEGPHAASGESLAPPPQAAPAEPKLSHESDPSLAPAVAEREADPYKAEESALLTDTTHDYSLPTASKLKALERKPEVTAPFGAGLKNILLTSVHRGGLAEGALANSYYEPSVEQFTHDQASLLSAKKIQPGTPEFQEFFNEYKDRKWAQAHDAAEAEGRPLTRMEYIDHQANRGAWDKLSDTLANAADATSAFAKGLAAGRTLQLSKLIAPIQDKVFGTDQEATDQAQAERHPYASFAGDLYGSIKGPLGKITQAATIPRLAGSTAMGARIGGAAISGAAGGVADLAARSAATGASDVIGGGDTSRGVDQFKSHLAGSALLGAGFGAAGQGIAEVANAYQRAGSSLDMDQFRAGGGDTDIIRGLRPGPEVKANVEGARPPIPGEAKTRFGGTPTEFAANKIREPLAKAHTDMNAATYERLGGEKNAYIDAHPEAQGEAPVRNTAQQVVSFIRSKLQPNAPGFIPGARLKTSQVTPGGDLTEASKLAQQVFKPKVVTAVEAQNEAAANGGFVVSIGEAKKLGFDVPEHGLDATGVPEGAPSIESGAAGETVSIPKILPKYPKDIDAGRLAPDVTPEEADAIRRYTWGKRKPGDSDLVNGYLERAPITTLPHVYRGIAVRKDTLADLLGNTHFTTGNEPTSVSWDPTVARSFAARNSEPGDVGVTFKLENASARNISALAHDQVGMENELLLPARRRFEIVSKHPDPATPGDWIVVAKEVAPESSAGSTAEDVFGAPAEKPSASSPTGVTAKGDSFEVNVASPRFKTGMRDSSLEYLKANPGDADRLGKPRIEVYPDTGPNVADGRHRMLLAAQRGERSIDAEIVHYDADGNVVSRETKPISLKATELGPRPGRAFKTPPTDPSNQDWFDAETHAKTVAKNSTRYGVTDPFAAKRSAAPRSPLLDTPTGVDMSDLDSVRPSVRPNGPPSELLGDSAPKVSDTPPVSAPGPASDNASDWLVPTSYSDQAKQALAAKMSPDNFKVVLVPHEYNAQKFEDILGDIDRKAGYAKAQGNHDPMWEGVAEAIRADRKRNFGDDWANLIGEHHKTLNKLEQRSFHAGMAEDKLYDEQSGGAQVRLQNKLREFPNPNDTNSQKALREIAASAPPEVKRDLEVLGATNAYQKLKGSAALKTAETFGGGGIAGRLTGVGGFLKPRVDALARGLSAGPTGGVTITPRVAEYLRSAAPGPKWLPGVPRMGGGALGLKAAVAYDALTPQQQALLGKLVDKFRKPAATAETAQ